MVTRVNVHDAKTHLSALLARVERGETIEIARAGKPIARLEPFHPTSRIKVGFLDITTPESFFEDLPEDELAAWE